MSCKISGACMAGMGLLAGVTWIVSKVLVSLGLGWSCLVEMVTKLDLYGLVVLLAVAGCSSVWLLKLGTGGGGPGGHDSDAQEVPAAGPREPLPPPVWGDHITVLSIDGGGIRGLIPAVILEALEEELQDVEKQVDPNGDWEDARIADYFDVIAGTSTGGLIAAMLTTPHNETTRRPKFTTRQIKDHYWKIGPKIFSPRGWLYTVKSFFCGPKYDSTFLREEIKRILGGITLADTLTNVVVPTFDVSRLSTINFSSFKPQVNSARKKIHLLSNVCIGTTAAPTYFKAHDFKAYYTNNTVRCGYHLIDGGVGANNPTMVAISRVATEVVCGNEMFVQVQGQKMDYENLVVISIGTGSSRKKRMDGKYTGIYTAPGCAKWGAIDWIFNWGRKPIIDMLMRASDFLIDVQVATLLKSHECKNYLRIQALEVEERHLSLDDTKSMNKLVNIGVELLGAQEYRVNVYSGEYEMIQPPTERRTNRVALKSYATTLVKERHLRIQRKLSAATANGGPGVPPLLIGNLNPQTEAIPPETPPTAASESTPPPAQIHTEDRPQSCSG